MNKQYSEKAEKYQHNVVDAQASFSYELKDVDSLNEMPKDLLNTIKRTEDWALCWYAKVIYYLWNVLKYCSNKSIRKRTLFKNADMGKFWRPIW